jgi:hypothetical protein
MNKEPYHQPLLTRHRLPRAVAAKTASECALLLVCSDTMAAGVELMISKVGTNVVVSWPASATNLALESSSSLATGWTAVATAPVTNQQVVSVSLPATGLRRFFRLKTNEKDPLADKDPTEKDPTSDKDPNEKPPGEKDPNEKTLG